MENKNTHIPAQAWNDAVLWPHGSLVRHNKELYRSEGLCTAAEPGNSGHYRFYVSIIRNFLSIFSFTTHKVCDLLTGVIWQSHGFTMLFIGIGVNSYRCSSSRTNPNNGVVPNTVHESSDCDELLHALQTDERLFGVLESLSC